MVATISCSVGYVQVELFDSISYSLLLFTCKCIYIFIMPVLYSVYVNPTFHKVANKVICILYQVHDVIIASFIFI